VQKYVREIPQFNRLRWIHESVSKPCSMIRRRMYFTSPTTPSSTNAPLDRHIPLPQLSREDSHRVLTQCSLPLERYPSSFSFTFTALLGAGGSDKWGAASLYLPWGLARSCFVVVQRSADEGNLLASLCSNDLLPTRSSFSGGWGERMARDEGLSGEH
jgi:hypothetical protein